MNNLLKSVKNLLLLLPTTCSLLLATTIEVPADQPTIQGGIDSASNGDTVLVQPGTYIENITLNNKQIVMGSLMLTTGDTSYISQTVIDGNGSGSVITFINVLNSATVFCGFTVTNGYAHNGGGIYCDSSNIRLEHLLVIGNTASSKGGGIYCFYDSYPTLANVTIRNNSAAQDGGGVYCYYSDPKLINVVISGNRTLGTQSYYGGGGIYCYGSSPILINVTITGNSTALSGGGIYCYSNANPILVNTILWDDSPHEIYFALPGNPNFITISYTDLQGGEAGIVTNNHATVFWEGGNIDVNPMFVDAGNDNLHLQQSSICIDAGTALFVWEEDTLFNLGPDEYIGSAPDMGAFEYDVLITTKNDIPQLPDIYTLHQNYPNPFNPITTISYDLVTRTHVIITIYDLLGRKVKTLVDQVQLPGYKSINWDATDNFGEPVGVGVYLYKISAGSFGQTSDFTQTKKMILLR